MLKTKSHQQIIYIKGIICHTVGAPVDLTLSTRKARILEKKFLANPSLGTMLLNNCVAPTSLEERENIDVKILEVNASIWITYSNDFNYILI